MPPMQLDLRPYWPMNLYGTSKYVLRKSNIRPTGLRLPDILRTSLVRLRTFCVCICLHFVNIFSPTLWAYTEISAACSYRRRDTFTFACGSDIRICIIRNLAWVGCQTTKTCLPVNIVYWVCTKTSHWDFKNWTWRKLCQLPDMAHNGRFQGVDFFSSDCWSVWNFLNSWTVVSGQ